MSLSRTERHRLMQIARGRSDEGLRVLEGAKAVADALRETDAVAELWLRSDLAAATRTELEALADARGVGVGAASRSDVDRLAGVVTPQGVFALVRDVARPLEEVLEASGLVLWLDGVQDPGNVGALVRIAAAFGAAGLLVGTGTADPLGLKALRASTGLALRVPFTRVPSETIAAALPVRPVWLLDTGGDDVFEIEEAPADLVLVVGAEGQGVGAAARGVAGRCLGIPLARGVDSLNAAVAAGIAVAWLARRSS